MDEFVSDSLTVLIPFSKIIDSTTVLKTKLCIQSTTCYSSHVNFNAFYELFFSTTPLKYDDNYIIYFNIIQKLPQ